MPESKPMYVTTVVPEYAAKHLGLDQYTPWYVGHPDCTQLRPDVLIDLCAGGAEDGEPFDDSESLFAALEGHGYTVFHSSDNAQPVVVPIT